MRRREFLGALGSAATVWPLAVRAQQPVMPVIGFLGSATAKDWAPNLAVFLKSLSEIGYVDGRNVTIDTDGPTATMIGCRPWRPI